MHIWAAAGGHRLMDLRRPLLSQAETTQRWPKIDWLRMGQRCDFKFQGPSGRPARETCANPFLMHRSVRGPSCERTESRGNSRILLPLPSASYRKQESARLGVVRHVGLPAPASSRGRTGDLLAHARDAAPNPSMSRNARALRRCCSGCCLYRSSPSA